MDYKNILEGTRPFFQGLPLPSPQPPPPPQESHHLTQQQPGHQGPPFNHHNSSTQPNNINNNNNNSSSSSIKDHQGTLTKSQSYSSLPHHNLLIGGTARSSSSSGGSSSTSHHHLDRPNSSSNNNHHNLHQHHSHSVGSGGGSGSAVSSSSSSLHLHPVHHALIQQNIHPLGLPQDGESVIRSKFAEGLGATLSQMYAGVGASHHHHSLNSHPHGVPQQPPPQSYSSTSHRGPQQQQTNPSSAGILMLERLHSSATSSSNSSISSSTPSSQHNNSTLHNSSLLVKSPRQSPSKTIINNPPNSGGGVSSASGKGDSKSINSGMVGSGSGGIIRRESPLDLSVKTVRVSADSSTSSLPTPPTSEVGSVLLMGVTSNGNGGNKCSTPNKESPASSGGGMVASNVNSTTNHHNSTEHLQGQGSLKGSGGSKARGRSREKIIGREHSHSPIHHHHQQRYPSPQQSGGGGSSRQQSPSSSSSSLPPPTLPIHQRGLFTPGPPANPTPPPRTSSGGGSNGGLQQPSSSNLNLQSQPPPGGHHHLLYPPQGSPNRLNNSVPQNNPYHPHYQTTPLVGPPTNTPPAVQSNSTSTPTPPLNSRPPSVIPPYNPHQPLAPPTSYHHPQTPPTYQHGGAVAVSGGGYPQYHPHFTQQPPHGSIVHPTQQHHPSQQQQQQSQYYPQYVPQQQQQQQQPTTPKPGLSSASTATPPNSVNHQNPPGYAPNTPNQQPQQTSGTSKLSHPSSSPYPLQQQQPYYQHHHQQQQQQQHYYGAPPPHPQHNLTYPPYAHPSAAPPPSAPTPNVNYSHSHYSQHISYPTYLPSSQRNASQPQQPLPPQQQQPSQYMQQPTPSSNFQPHPGLRPTTPTGPPPPLLNNNSSTNPYAAVQQQPPTTAPNLQQHLVPLSYPPEQPQPPPPIIAPPSTPNNAAASLMMKPPSSTLARSSPSSSRPPKSRKNVLNMLRNSVESRMHEKQEKEKFQFNSHQTWNFHGRKFNSSLPNLHNLQNQVPTHLHLHQGLQSRDSSTSSTPYSSVGGVSSLSASSSTTSMTTTTPHGGPSSNSKSSSTNPFYTNNKYDYTASSPFYELEDPAAALQRIKTKAEKKQLFPNLLSQIEQEQGGNKKDGRNNRAPTSVFDFNDDDDFGVRLNIPQPTPGHTHTHPHHPSSSLPGSLSPPKKPPRSPKKVGGSSPASSRRGSNNSGGGGNRKGSKAASSLSNAATTTNHLNQKKTEIGGEAEISKVDDFWATCDSFLDDLQSNPNSITSRRGGLWQQIKAIKSKPKVVNAAVAGSAAGTSTSILVESSDPDAAAGTAIHLQQTHLLKTPKAVRGGGRMKKNSEDEDSDFQVEEDAKSEEEEEEEEGEDEDDSGGSDDDSSVGGSRKKSGRVGRRKRQRSLEDDDEEEEDDKQELKTKRRRVLHSEEENDDDDEDNSDDDEGDKRVQSGRKGSINSLTTPTKRGSITNTVGRRGGRRKLDSSEEDEEEEDDDSDGGGVRRRSKGAKKGKRSSKRQRRSARKRGAIPLQPQHLHLDDEDVSDATSKTSDDSGSVVSYNVALSSNDSSDSNMNSNSSSEDDDDDSDSENGSDKKKLRLSSRGGGGKRKRRGSSSEDNHNKNSAKSSEKKGKKSVSKKGVNKKNKKGGSGVYNDDDDDYEDENFEPRGLRIKLGGKGGRKRKLPKRNCAPVPGHGKLKDISGESAVEGELGGGSSGEEWIMRGDLTKKKRKIVFGDGSDFKRPGWEEELIDFKRKLRMPHKLIQVSKPSSHSMSPAGSLTGDKMNPTPLPPTHLVQSTSTPIATDMATGNTSKASSAKENKVPQPPPPSSTPVSKKFTPTTPSKTPNLKEKESPGGKGKGSKGAAAATTPTKGKGRRPPTSFSTPTTPTSTFLLSSPRKGKKGKGGVPQLQHPPPLSESESPLDEPTIERAVERMKAAADNAVAVAKLAQKNKKCKTKPVLSKACSGPIPAKKTKGKNSSSLDELPVLSPQTTLTPQEDEDDKKVMGIKVEEGQFTPPSSALTATSTPTTDPTTKTKKGIRRNKFKSGFDYIRKKKKIPTNADGSAVIPTPKKVKILIEKNVTVEDIQTEIRGWVLNKGHGETALHRAARLGYPDVAAYCLEHELCPANCKDNAGYTPLHETCIKGNLEVAKVLLVYGADPSQSAPGGIRPLHEACENGHVELVRLLISYGADPTLTTYAGQSPLELAEPHSSVRVLLDQHINDVLGAKEKAWEFKGSGSWVDNLHELGFDATADPPPTETIQEEDSDGFEFEASEAPLPPLYKIKEKIPYYLLLNDVLNYLGLGRDKFLKSHPTAETVELNSNDFLEQAHCCHLLGEKFNLNSSSDLLTLIKYDDRVKKMLNIESCFIR